MKTVFKNILVLALVLGTYTSYANTILEVAIASNTVNKGDYISVSDASGEVIYSGRINHSGDLSNLYDFSHLKDCIYTIEVNKDFEIEMRTVQVENNKVTFLKESNKKIFKPVFRSKDARVIISKLAIDTQEMLVELYFKNELIHTETVKGEKILNRVYKLDNTLKGEYSVIIKSNDRVYVENFRI